MTDRASEIAPIADDEMEPEEAERIGDILRAPLTAPDKPTRENPCPTCGSTGYAVLAAPAPDEKGGSR